MNERKRNEIMPACKDCEGCNGCMKNQFKIEVLRILLTPKVLIGLTFLFASIGSMIDSMKG